MFLYKVIHFRNNLTENRCLQLRGSIPEFLIEVSIHQARWNHVVETGFGSVGRMKQRQRLVKRFME